MTKWLILAAIFIVVQSCDSDPDESIVCTEEFRTIGVNITGVDLTAFYTVRTSTEDTIRLQKFGTDLLSDFYPILDDSYLPKLENDQDTFVFYGFESGAITPKVEEQYVIKADQCHIELVSGKTEINF